MGFFSRLFAGKPVEPQVVEPDAPLRLTAVVELRSPQLLAFDLPGEGMRYTIPDFTPGEYAIPMEAIVRAETASNTGNGCIEVDTGTIYFIDAVHEHAFRKYEARLFEETGDSYAMVEDPEAHADGIGIRFGCLAAPGIGSGYAFEGDGSYVLDISLIRKV